MALEFPAARVALRGGDASAPRFSRFFSCGPFNLIVYDKTSKVIMLCYCFMCDYKMNYLALFFLFQTDIELGLVVGM